jgi:hypothetical protein
MMLGAMRSHFIAGQPISRDGSHTIYKFESMWDTPDLSEAGERFTFTPKTRFPFPRVRVMLMRRCPLTNELRLFVLRRNA